MTYESIEALIAEAERAIAKIEEQNEELEKEIITGPMSKIYDDMVQTVIKMDNVVNKLNLQRDEFISISLGYWGDRRSIRLSNKCYPTIFGRVGPAALNHSCPVILGINQGMLTKDFETYENFISKRVGFPPTAGKSHELAAMNDFLENWKEHKESTLKKFEEKIQEIITDRLKKATDKNDSLRAKANTL